MTDPLNPVDLILKLESLLSLDGYEKTDLAYQKLSQLKGILSDIYDFSLSSTDYTEQRASSLQQISVKLQSLIAASQVGSYSTKAFTLAHVGDAYLKLAHAFKVDSAVWALAQSELVPLLISSTDEKTIDVALTALLRHLDMYVKSLNHWLIKK